MVLGGLGGWVVVGRKKRGGPINLALARFAECALLPWGRVVVVRVRVRVTPLLFRPAAHRPASGRPAPSSHQQPQAAQRSVAGRATTNTIDLNRGAAGLTAPCARARPAPPQLGQPPLHHPHPAPAVLRERRAGAAACHGVGLGVARALVQHRVGAGAVGAAGARTGGLHLLASTAHPVVVGDHACPAAPPSAANGMRRWHGAAPAAR